MSWRHHRLVQALPTSTAASYCAARTTLATRSRRALTAGIGVAEQAVDRTRPATATSPAGTSHARRRPRTRRAAEVARDDRQPEAHRLEHTAAVPLRARCSPTRTRPSRPSWRGRRQRTEEAHPAGEVGGAGPGVQARRRTPRHGELAPGQLDAHRGSRATASSSDAVALPRREQRRASRSPAARAACRRRPPRPATSRRWGAPTTSRPRARSGAAVASDTATARAAAPLRRRLVPRRTSRRCAARVHRVVDQPHERRRRAGPADDRAGPTAS